EEWLKTHISELASSASEKLGNRLEFTPGEVLANADYFEAGYGVLTESEREAIHLFAKHEGLLLDPVYTGRAAAGMIDLIRQKFFKNGEDGKSTGLNSSHRTISYAVFCLKKKK